ncbi:MAG: 30S ribosomal protein S18 [Chloroflexi bacterium]|nr:30S ribosomal protein S18 [Chloroflexota bacterium]
MSEDTIVEERIEDTEAESEAAPEPRRRPSESKEQRPQRGRGRYGAPRLHLQVCTFCVDGVKHIDYKNTDMLAHYLTDRGKIKPRRKTGLCAKHQRRLSVAIKRARHLALLPFTVEYTHV